MPDGSIEDLPSLASSGADTHFLPQRDNVKPVAIRNDGQCQLCESVNALNIRLPRSRLKAHDWLEAGSEKFRQVVILALVQR